MIVGFASTEGGCLHYRAELPAARLRAQGVEVVTSSDLFFDPDGGPIGVATQPLEKTGNYAPSGWIDPDVLVLAGGWPRIGPENIARAQAAGQRIICDCDDWPWLPTGNPHHTVGGGAQKLLNLRAADHVTVSTPYLADLLARERIASTLCPNTIDLDDWRQARADAVNDLVRPLRFVGYRGMLGGFHDGDVRELAGELDGDFRYVHVGADPRELKSFARLARLHPSIVDRRPAVPFPEYNGVALWGVDLALVPYALRPFSLAKSNIACMEWCAAGVPWLASNLDEAARLGQAGMVHDGRWRERILELRDASARYELHRRQFVALERWIEQADRAPWLDVILGNVPATA